jgi:hypothetical protein
VWYRNDDGWLCWKCWHKTVKRERGGYFNEWFQRTRNKLFVILGEQCIRCGFSDKRALQFDHINGDGAKERKLKSAKTYVIYKYYILHPEEAKERLQVLCANCNSIKRIENKEYN